jgi:hypothetical protein
MTKVRCQPTTDELLDLVEWARATESLFPAHALKYARIAELLGNYTALKARIEELESNERAYEEIIGPMTYREVADRIKELEDMLAPFAEIARELTDALKDSDKNTMHWAVPTVGNLRAALRTLKAGS